MKNKGKILAILVSFAFLFGFFSPMLAETDTGFISAGSNAGYNTGDRDIVNYIQRGINFVLGIVAFVFFSMILYGGLRWMTSRGQEQLKEKAIEAITNATIGLAIVVGAYALVAFVFSKLNPVSTAATVTPTVTDDSSSDTDASDTGCCVTQNDHGPSCRPGVKWSDCHGTWERNSICQPTWCGSGSADYNRDHGAI